MNNKCSYCGKELSKIVIRHHTNQNMKYENPERYKEFRNEDIELLCSVSCHSKIHQIRIYDKDGRCHSIYELERMYGDKNIKSRIFMAQKRGQKHFKIKGDIYTVPLRNKPYKSPHQKMFMTEKELQNYDEELKNYEMLKTTYHKINTNY